MNTLKVDHLAFPCADAEATLRFHVEILGAALTCAARADERARWKRRLPEQGVRFTVEDEGPEERAAARR